MIKKIFDRALNVNNENLMEFGIRIRVLKHSILLKLGLRNSPFKECSNNREKKRQGTEKKTFEIWRCSN